MEKIHKSPGYPSKERLAKGSVAIIECIEEIPCNPCESACRFGAIVIGKPITNVPKLIQDRCKGCGECIASCPGLAIFLIDMTYSAEEASISFPYEFHPLPTVGVIADALDRFGQKVCDCKIIKVSNAPKNDKTAVVTITVKKEFADIVRNFKLINN